MFPAVAEDDLRQLFSVLLYTQHGGSGYTGFSHDSLMSMEIRHVIWYAERLAEFREDEARQIREAHRKK